MMKRACTILALSVVLGANSAWAECSIPAKPDMPVSGATLSEVEYKALEADVNAYFTQSAALRACLEPTVNNPEEGKEAEWRVALEDYNATARNEDEVFQAFADVQSQWIQGAQARARVAAAEAEAAAAAKAEADLLKALQSNSDGQ